jgi:uncharacterized protein YecE (DUF72 family)
MSAAGKIRIGVGGWSYAPWRQTFYPEGVAQKGELAYASSRLTAIEINATFYRSQKPQTYAGWRNAVPDGFVFALKAPRYATNRKLLAEAGESVHRFAEGGLAELGPKLGPLLWQLAPTKRFDPEDIAAFLALLPGEASGLRLRHAIEVRHATFRCPEMVELARRHGVAIVWAADSKYPEIADQTADFAYVRLMGTREGEPLGYDAAGLDRRAEQLRALASGASPEGVELLAASAERKPRDVFCFVISGHKASNPAAAMALIERLS